MIFSYVLLSFWLSWRVSAMESMKGCRAENISSDSEQFSWVGNWVAENATEGHYAHSNDSSAAVTFRFRGIRAQYIAHTDGDTGSCKISMNGRHDFHLDMFDTSIGRQPSKIFWDSGILPYDNHAVKLHQTGIDGRLARWPRLISGDWVQFVPEDIAMYTQTMPSVLPAATFFPASPAATPTVYTTTTYGSPGLAPIIGGAVGGVVVIISLACLFLLWQRDRNENKRAVIDLLSKTKRGHHAEDEEKTPKSGTARSPKSEHVLETEAELTERHRQERESLRRGSSHAKSNASSPTDDVEKKTSKASDHSSSRMGTTRSGPIPGRGTVSRTSSANSTSPSPHSTHPSDYTTEPGTPSSSGQGDEKKDDKCYPHHTQEFESGLRSFPIPEI